MAISNLAATLIARAHMVLRRRLPILRHVNKDFADVPCGVGEAIYIDVPGDAEEAGNASAAAYFDPGTKSSNTKTLSLSSWIEDGWYLKDDDLAKISQQSGFVPNLMKTSIEGMALRIANDIWSVYKGVYAAVGTAGNTPFGSSTDVIVDAGVKLDDMLCPVFDRVALYNSAAKGNLLKLDAYKSFEKRGPQSQPILAEGELGRYLGFDHMLDQAVPLHTSGTLSDGNSANALVNGALAADATTMNLDAATLTGTLVAGDVFTFAGDSQQYVVVTGGTAAGNALTGITFQPPLVNAVADNTEITLVASHRVNLAFRPDAIYFGSRRMEMSEHAKRLIGDARAQGNDVLEVTLPDPETGIVLRMVIVRQKYRIVVNFDCMYGFLLVQPKMTCRILGGSS
jgi:hypothetical protein